MDGSSGITDEQLIILHQCFIAVGQGIGCYRVSRKACTAIQAYCLAYLQDPRPGAGKGKTLGQERVEQWSGAEYGPQALERLRVIGKRAAQQACEQGHTVVQPGHFKAAAKLVEDTNRDISEALTVGESSEWCQEPPEARGV